MAPKRPETSALEIFCTYAAKNLRFAPWRLQISAGPYARTFPWMRVTHSIIPPGSRAPCKTRFHRRMCPGLSWLRPPPSPEHRRVLRSVCPRIGWLHLLECPAQYVQQLVSAGVRRSGMSNIGSCAIPARTIHSRSFSLKPTSDSDMGNPAIAKIRRAHTVMRRSQYGHTEPVCCGQAVMHAVMNGGDEA